MPPASGFLHKPSRHGRASQGKTHKSVRPDLRRQWQLFSQWVRAFGQTMRSNIALKSIGEADGIGDEAVHFPHVHGLVEALAAAAAVTGMLADSSSGSRQRIVHEMTDSNASSSRCSLYNCRKRGMFMCSGQLFSQGESARPSHTPAWQRRATM